MKAFNMDQVISLGNYLLAFVASYLLAQGVDNNLVSLAQGIFASVMTLAIGVWMNGDNLWDALQSVMRKTIAMVGAFAVARGWLNAETAAMVTGAIMSALPVIWAMLFYSDKPGPNFPGTTIVDPVKVTTTSGQVITVKPAITDPAKVPEVRDSTPAPLELTEANRAPTDLLQPAGTLRDGPALPL